MKKKTENKTIVIELYFKKARGGYKAKPAKSVHRQTLVQNSGVLVPREFLQSKPAMNMERKTDTDFLFCYDN